VVITKPLAAIVQANQKQVRAVQLLQHFVTALIAGEGVAERAVQARENRSAQQEILDLLGLAVQHFFQQVIEYETIIAGKLLHQLGTVGSVLQGQRGELQTGDPAFGSVFERRDVRRRQLEVHHLVQERRCFTSIEAQIGSAQFLQLAACAQATEWKRRIAARGDERVSVRREALDQEAQRVVDAVLLDDVIIVKRHHKLFVVSVDFVQQRREYNFQRRRIRSAQQLRAFVAEIVVDHLERADEVVEKPQRIVVFLVEGDPRQRRFAVFPPRRHQRRLAETRRRRHERQPAAQTVL